MDKVESVDQFFDNLSKWREELELLRSIILSTELEENLKWGIPTYSIKGKNVLSISGFKNHFGIWFFQGSLLVDKSNQLKNAQEGKTKAMRQWRFLKEDVVDSVLVLKYVEEAVKNQLSGKKILTQSRATFIMSPVLESCIKFDVELADCFEKLTKGKQKEYSNYISEAKQESTKERRLKKIVPMIKVGVGLNDKYKNCKVSS